MITPLKSLLLYYHNLPIHHLSFPSIFSSSKIPSLHTIMSSLKSGFLNLSKSDPSLLETKIPAFLYGTAWKKERTTHLVTEALRSGFNGVDTAAQPKHYREDLVGDALRVIEFGKERRREDLYVRISSILLLRRWLMLIKLTPQIQTKFTSINGQDPQNLPYNPHHPLPSQIRSSVASSLHNLRPSNPANSNQAPEQCLDCLVLHSPLPQFSETLSAWQTLEEYVPHPIRTLGISNVNLPTLKSLWDAVRIKPAIVQNRFYPATAYDVALRKFCVEKGIVYQSF